MAKNKTYLQLLIIWTRNKEIKVRRNIIRARINGTQRQ